MRLKNNKIFILVPLLALIMLFISDISSSTIVGSSHDLSSLTGGGEHFISSNEDEICIFCHSPHQAIVDDGDGNKLPLWNRNFGPSSDPNRDKTGFTLYSSATLNATMSQPRGYTLLCLSCHDGITAINSLVNYGRHDPIIMQGGGDQLGDTWNPSFPRYPGMNIGGAIPGSGTYGPYGSVGPTTKRLDDDHPVSFVFNEALISADMAGSSTPKLKLPVAPSKLKLFNGRLECPTCHNVHEQGGGYDKITQPDQYEINRPFLRVTKDKSQICTDCHIK